MTKRRVQVGQPLPLHKPEGRDRDCQFWQVERSHHVELEMQEKRAMECEKHLLGQGFARSEEDYDTWHKKLNEESDSTGTDGYRTKYLKEDDKTPKWETTTVPPDRDWSFPEVSSDTAKDVVRNPFERQVGGDHYRGFKIQPAIFCETNGLSFFSSSIVKYACRFKQKGGEEDLKKIIHYAQMALEFYYSKSKAIG